MPQKLTRKQIYEMRGQLKVPQRAEAMRKRYAQARYRYVIKTQGQIAKHVVERIGEF